MRRSSVGLKMWSVCGSGESRILAIGVDAERIEQEQMRYKMTAIGKSLKKNLLWSFRVSTLLILHKAETVLKSLI